MKAHKYLKKYLPKLTDYLLGTDADTSNKTTRNFQLNDIKSLVLEGLGVDGGGKLRVTEIEIATLVTDISTTINAMTEYIVNKSEIVFFNVAGSVYVLKQSDVTIGLGADPLTNDDFLLLASESGITTLTEASDFPNSYTGQALKLLRVNTAGNAVEFVTDNSIKQVAIGGTNLTITSGVVTIPNASDTQAGLVSVDGTQTFKGKKIFKMLGNSSNSTYDFIITDSDGVEAFKIAQNRDTTFLGILRVTENMLIANSQIQLYVDGNTTGVIKQTLSVIEIGQNTAQDKRIKIDIDTGNVTIGASAGVTTTQKFEVFSIVNGTIPYPIMTNAQRLDVGFVPKIGCGVYVSDVGANEGIWIYKSTGWKHLAEV